MIPDDLHALRKWAIEQAIRQYGDNLAGHIIDAAKQYEDYVLGQERRTITIASPVVEVDPS